MGAIFNALGLSTPAALIIIIGLFLWAVYSHDKN